MYNFLQDKDLIQTLLKYDDFHFGMSSDKTQISIESKFFEHGVVIPIDDDHNEMVRSIARVLKIEASAYPDFTHNEDSKATYNLVKDLTGEMSPADPLYIGAHLNISSVIEKDDRLLGIATYEGQEFDFAYYKKTKELDVYKVDENGDFVSLDLSKAVRNYIRRKCDDFLTIGTEEIEEDREIEYSEEVLKEEIPEEPEIEQTEDIDDDTFARLYAKEQERIAKKKRIKELNEWHYLQFLQRRYLEEVDLMHKIGENTSKTKFVALDDVNTAIAKGTLDAVSSADLSSVLQGADVVVEPKVFTYERENPDYHNDLQNEVRNITNSYNIDEKAYRKRLELIREEARKVDENAYNNIRLYNYEVFIEELETNPYVAHQDAVIRNTVADFVVTPQQYEDAIAGYFNENNQLKEEYREKNDLRNEVASSAAAYSLQNDAVRMQVVNNFSNEQFSQIDYSEQQLRQIMSDETARQTIYNAMSESASPVYENEIDLTSFEHPFISQINEAVAEEMNESDVRNFFSNDITEQQIDQIIRNVLPEQDVYKVYTDKIVCEMSEKQLTETVQALNPDIYSEQQARDILSNYKNVREEFYSTATDEQIRSAVNNYADDQEIRSSFFAEDSLKQLTDSGIIPDTASVYSNEQIRNYAINNQEVIDSYIQEAPVQQLVHSMTDEQIKNVYKQNGMTYTGRDTYDKDFTEEQIRRAAAEIDNRRIIESMTDEQAASAVHSVNPDIYAENSFSTEQIVSAMNRDQLERVQINQKDIVSSMNRDQIASAAKVIIGAEALVYSTQSMQAYAASNVSYDQAVTLIKDTLSQEEKRNAVSDYISEQQAREYIAREATEQQTRNIIENNLNTEQVQNVVFNTFSTQTINNVVKNEENFRTAAAQVVTPQQIQTVLADDAIATIANASNHIAKGDSVVRDEWNSQVHADIQRQTSPIHSDHSTQSNAAEDIRTNAGQQNTTASSVQTDVPNTDNYKQSVSDTTVPATDRSDVPEHDIHTAYEPIVHAGVPNANNTTEQQTTHAQSMQPNVQERDDSVVHTAYEPAREVVHTDVPNATDQKTSPDESSKQNTYTSGENVTHTDKVPQNNEIHGTADQQTANNIHTQATQPDATGRNNSVVHTDVPNTDNTASNKTQPISGHDAFGNINTHSDSIHDKPVNKSSVDNTSEVQSDTSKNHTADVDDINSSSDNTGFYFEKHTNTSSKTEKPVNSNKDTASKSDIPNVKSDTALSQWTEKTSADKASGKKTVTILVDGVEVEVPVSGKKVYSASVPTGVYGKVSDDNVDVLPPIADFKPSDKKHLKSAGEIVIEGKAVEIKTDKEEKKTNWKKENVNGKETFLAHVPVGSYGKIDNSDKNLPTVIVPPNFNGNQQLALSGEEEESLNVIEKKRVFISDVWLNVFEKIGERAAYYVTGGGMIISDETKNTDDYKQKQKIMGTVNSVLKTVGAKNLGRFYNTRGISVNALSRDLVLLAANNGRSHLSVDDIISGKFVDFKKKMSDDDKKLFTMYGDKIVAAANVKLMLLEEMRKSGGLPDKNFVPEFSVGDLNNLMKNRFGRDITHLTDTDLLRLIRRSDTSPQEKAVLKTLYDKRQENKAKSNSKKQTKTLLLKGWKFMLTMDNDDAVKGYDDWAGLYHATTSTLHLTKTSLSVLAGAGLTVAKGLTKFGKFVYRRLPEGAKQKVDIATARLEDDSRTVKGKINEKKEKHEIKKYNKKTKKEQWKEQNIPLYKRGKETTTKVKKGLKKTKEGLLKAYQASIFGIIGRFKASVSQFLNKAKFYLFVAVAFIFLIWVIMMFIIASIGGVGSIITSSGSVIAEDEASTTISDAYDRLVSYSDARRSAAKSAVNSYLDDNSSASSVLEDYSIDEWGHPENTNGSETQEDFDGINYYFVDATAFDDTDEDGIPTSDHYLASNYSNEIETIAVAAAMFNNENIDTNAFDDLVNDLYEIFNEEVTEDKIVISPIYSNAYDCDDYSDYTVTFTYYCNDSDSVSEAEDKIAEFKQYLSDLQDDGGGVYSYSWTSVTSSDEQSSITTGIDETYLTYTAETNDWDQLITTHDISNISVDVSSTDEGCQSREVEEETYVGDETYEYYDSNGQLQTYSYPVYETTYTTEYYCNGHTVTLSASVDYGRKDVNAYIVVWTLENILELFDVETYIPDWESKSYAEYIRTFVEDGGFSNDELETSYKYYVENLVDQDWEELYGIEISSDSNNSSYTSISTAASSEEVAAIVAAAQASGDLDEVREAIVEYAKLIASKGIPYYWGGKADSADYDENNFYTTVSADNKGRTQKGLDCSGFVNFIIWGITGNQWYLSSGTYSTPGVLFTDVEYLEIGDLGLFKEAGESGNHIGIFCGYDDDGNMIWVHCGCTNGATEWHVSVENNKFVYFYKLSEEYLYT